jgi:AhpD family alkylhydroperoxidase
MAHPYKHMLSLDNAVGEYGSLDPRLRELVKIRASQLNGCAYCLKMHTDDARSLGEDDARMHVLAGWREAPNVFDERERTALELTEAVTLMREPGPAYDRAREAFGDEDAEAAVGRHRRQRLESLRGPQAYRARVRGGDHRGRMTRPG